MMSLGSFCMILGCLRRYLEGFLSVKDNYAPAYKLMGQICEAMKSSESALAAYKRSLDLDAKQKDVLIKGLCQLFRS